MIFLNKTSLRSLLIALIAIIISLSPNSSHALSPETRLIDESQEQRAMQLFLQVRCLVCQGQVIENSDTAFSFEMRKMIRKEIQEGKSDQKIKDDLVKEFGDDILTEISAKNNKILLWLPFAFGTTLLAGFLIFTNRKRNIS